MTAVWHASYCREAWRLYDAWLVAASDTNALEADVLKVRREWEEHLNTCNECVREKKHGMSE